MSADKPVESEEVRVMRKFIEKLEAFSLAIKQVDKATEDLQKFCQQRMNGNHEN